MADPECARGGGVSHIMAEKMGASFTLFKKMHENSIFSPITGGGGGLCRVRPMLDPPLTSVFYIYTIYKLNTISNYDFFNRLRIA